MGTSRIGELPMLFQRILSNTTLDWFRRRKSRNALFSNLGDFDSPDEDGEFDLLESLDASGVSEQIESAETSSQRAQTMREIELGNTGFARSSTGSLPAALLGGSGCGGNRRCHGLFRR